MGGYMVVEIPEETTYRKSISAVTGRRRIVYNVVLHVFHLAHAAHAEDAEADCNGLLEAIKDYIYTDVTLGGICYQAGESRRGIRTRVRPSVVSPHEITGTEAEITFEAEVMIVA